MAFKLSLIVFTHLIVGIGKMPLAQAQLGGLLGPLLGLLRIQGVLYDTPMETWVSMAQPPLFPLMVSTATTNGSGMFSILLDPVSFLMSTLVSGCKLAVNTPLASCNAGLPSVGGLISDLQFIGNTYTRLLNIANVSPSGFRFSANM